MSCGKVTTYTVIIRIRAASAGLGRVEELGPIASETADENDVSVRADMMVLCVDIGF